MKKIFIALLVTIIITGASSAGIQKENIGITFGNLWLGARYMITPKIIAELRKGFESDINTLNVRGYYQIYYIKKYVLHAGLDLGTISFNAEGISGSGSSIMPYINCEMQINDSFLISADMGYSIITLGSQGVNVSGGEIIFDLNIVWYPYKK